MDMFEEIERAKKDLPKIRTITKEVGNYKFNGYQRFAIVIYIICFFLGIVFGNLFPACGSGSSLYAGTCVTTEFNFSLMIFIWFVSLLICLFFFALGHIILLLTSINESFCKISKDLK